MGKSRSKGRSGGPFMGGILVRVEKANGDRFNPFACQKRPRPHNIRHIQRPEHRAIGQHPLIYFAAIAPGDQRFGLVPCQVEHARRAQPSDLKHVSKALCRDKTTSRALFLQQRVRANRGAVQHFAQRPCGDRGSGQNLGHAGDHGLFWRVRGGADFGGKGHPVAAQQHKVGERAADINTQSGRKRHQAGRSELSTPPFAQSCVSTS